MKGTTIAAVGVVTVVVVAAAWQVSQRRAPQTEFTRAPLYPELIEQINDVRALALRSSEHHTRLERDGEQWVIANKDGFPARAGSARRTLLQLAALRTVEPKTRLPERYPRIGVAEVGGSGEDGDEAGGTLVEVEGTGDTALVSLIVGHAARAGELARHYVRRSGEEQSWLVEGELEVPADPVSWLDPAIVDIDTARVRAVRVQAPDAQPIHITKNARSDNFFELAGVPEGHVAKSRATVSSLGAALLDLRLNDVAAASRVAERTPQRITEVRTFDGLVVTLSDFELDGETFTAFDFAYDADAVVAEDPPGAAGTDTDNEAEGAAESAAAGETAAEADAATPTPGGAGDDERESVADEAARLEAATADWVYVLPDYKRRLLERDFESLIEPRQEEDAAAEPAAAE